MSESFFLRLTDGPLSLPKDLQVTKNEKSPDELLQLL